MAQGDFLPKNKKMKIKIVATDETVILALESKAFCASLSDIGIPTKKESNTIEDFSTNIGKATVSWVDYVVDDLKKDAPTAAKILGFNEVLVNSLLKNKESGYEDVNTEMGIMMPAIIVKGFDVKLEPIIVLIKDNLVVTLHTTEAKRFFRLRRYAEIFMRKIKLDGPPQDKVTMILIRILDENNSRNFDHLREIEENSDKLSKSLADPKTPRAIIGTQIHQMKHALVAYLGGLWATVDVLNTIRYGDPEILTDDPRLLNRLGMLSSEVHNHIGLAEHLSEVLASGLEVMQSIYNNQLQVLNNRMAMVVAYLTIIGTAVLVPNTIATVLGNSAFNLGPQDIGWYIVLLIGSTIAATVVSYMWVKKSGWLPEHTE